jgi:hypothetical protein
VSELQFEVQFDELPDFRADAVLDNTVFEVKLNLRDGRHFRTAVVEVAHLASTGRHSVLVLVEPQISDKRLRSEWEKLRQLFRPEIAKALTLVVRRAGKTAEVYGSLSGEERECIKPVAERARTDAARPVRRPSEAFFEILRVLLIHWSRKTGPLALKDLCDLAGCSYPTAALALEKLESYLTRHSDRSVELKAFPKNEWLRLVANADKIRRTLRFADRSGQPRSIESLLSRLQRHHPQNVAVAGVLGARRLLPELDLVGTPRLDLTMHSRYSEPNLSFLRQLDPSLRPAERDEPARLVIHQLQGPQTFFETDVDGTLWADPFECLLDLHEMRLESQAAEFLKYLMLESL